MTNQLINYLGNLGKAIIGNKSPQKKINFLEKRLAENKEFLGIIAHDLRSPAGTITGYLELLNETSLDEEQKLYADNLLILANQVIETSNLVGLAGKDLKYHKEMAEPINFEKRVSDLYGLNPILKKEGVELKTNYSGFETSLPGSIANFLVSNTVGDSFKHATPNTPINVETKIEGDNLKYSVRNSHQKDFRRDISGENSGKGKPFMKYIVEEIYGGKIEAHGEDGIWTTSFSIPLENLKPLKE